MKKLAFILTIFFTTILISSSIVLAESNMLHDAGNSIMNAAQGTKNVVEGAITGVGNMIGHGANSIMNSMTNNNTTTEQTNSTNKASTDRNADEDYTASRTATTAEGNLLGLSTTTWTWLIVATVGALIVAIVYFYGRQYDSMASNSHRDE